MSCSELLQVNRELLRIFLSNAGTDLKYQNMKRLNYLAFCDVGDGNYLAVNLSQPVTGNVFFLDHDYAYFPYGAGFTMEAYSHVANSLEEWLEQLVRTNGAEGMGSQFIPL